MEVKSHDLVDSNFYTLSGRVAITIEKRAAAGWTFVTTISGSRDGKFFASVIVKKD